MICLMYGPQSLLANPNRAPLHASGPFDSGSCRLLLRCTITVLGVAAGATLDRRIAVFIHESHIHPWMHTLPATIVKSFGVYYWFTIPAAIIVMLCHRYHGRAGIFVLMTGLICLLGNLLKWTIGRIRPFKLDGQLQDALPFALQPFRDGFAGLLSQKNLAFPSGHTMVAFTTAASLGILWPRWRLILYALATLVALERVVENAHWFSDTIGAAGLAICGVHLLWLVVGPWVIRNAPKMNNQ